jgi:hypothetical protein
MAIWVVKITRDGYKIRYIFGGALFLPKIKILKRNYCVLSINVVPSYQKVENLTFKGISQCLNKRWILLHSERTSILRDEVRSQKSIFNYKKKLKVERKEVRPGIEPGPAV